MTLALIDGDGLVYRCGFAAEKTFYLHTYTIDGIEYSASFDSARAAKENIKRREEQGAVNHELWSRKTIEPLDHCLATVKNSLNKTLDICGTKNFLLYIGGKDNFREKLYPEYKANRDGLPKPRYYKEIRQYLQDHWDAQVVDGMEVDDKLGIVAYEDPGSVIVSQDKDLQQIPGKHYDWTDGSFFDVTPEQGMRFFYQQALQGDATDNIQGIKGIGPKKAQAIIESAKTPRELAEVVYKTYADTLGHTPDSEVDLVCSLVWIRRKENDRHPLWRHLGREPI